MTGVACSATTLSGVWINYAEAADVRISASAFRLLVLLRLGKEHPKLSLNLNKFHSQVEELEGAGYLVEFSDVVLPQDFRKVYFVQAVDGGPIKIGISFDPTSRLRSIQTGSHSKLIVIGTIPGGRRKERELHERFREFRLNGEWFRAESALLDFICEETEPNEGDI